MSSNRELLESLAQHQRSFLAKLPAVHDALKANFDLLKTDLGRSEAWRQVYEEAHRLAGSSGIFGLPALGRTARRFEQLVEPLLDGGGPPDREDLAALARFVDQVREQLQLSAPPTPIKLPSIEQAHPPVVVIDDDRNFVETLRSQFDILDQPLISFESSEEKLDTKVAEANPGLVLIDLPTLERSALDCRQVLQNLEAVDILYTSSKGDLDERIAALRMGGQQFFLKPFHPTALIERLPVSARLHSETEAKSRIIIVDDDRELALTLSAILENVGYEALIVNKAEELLDVIAETPPDLILMDVHMPKYSGIELVSALRQDDNFVGIPFVFLTVESEDAGRSASLQAGGDDFISKPVSPQRLLSSIRSRITRSKKMRSLIDRDGMTNLLNHTRVHERLQELTLRAKRDQQPLSVAMIDIDHFKSINDRLGHSSGDQVIRFLSSFLKRRLRGYDIVGRCGGEEFMVIFPGLELTSAFEAIDRIRQEFASIEHQLAKQTVTISFSAGVAGLFPLGPQQDLALRADDALYEAKRNGRNQVCLARESDEDSQLAATGTSG